MRATIPEHERWFRSFSSRAEARTRLFCFPHAGGGPGLFRNWGNALPGSTEVLGATLPGHDERMMEKSFCEWPALLDALCDAIAPCLSEPFAFFGHSFGARLAFELTRRLEARNVPLPAYRLPPAVDPRPARGAVLRTRARVLRRTSRGFREQEADEAVRAGIARRREAVRVMAGHWRDDPHADRRPQRSAGPHRSARVDARMGTLYRVTVRVPEVCRGPFFPAPQ